MQGDLQMTVQFFFNAREGGDKKESDPEWLSLFFLFSVPDPPIPPSRVKCTYFAVSVDPQIFFEYLTLHRLA